jgi:amidohydrolase
MDSIHTAARELDAATIAFRRDLHRHPEIAFEEVRTSRLIAERLVALGLEPRTGLGGTGVTAVLEGAHGGKTVIARADIDALPILEEKDVAYRSTIPGRMHACGHDGHAAILLAVAEVLLGHRDALCGRVVFVFQPAEEVVQGAHAMLEDGALDGLAPDHAVGLHLTTNLPTGSIAVRAGAAMAAADRFDLVVGGSGGHAAKPHETVDPVVIAAHVVIALQSLVSRETDPVDQAVVSLTSIAGGTTYNVIPDRVAIRGTLRTFDPATRARLKERIVALATAVAQAHRGTLAADWIDGSPAVVNDPEVTARIRSVAARVVGIDRVSEMPLLMGGDDMSLWLQRAPGCYFFVGANGGGATAFAHHHARFDFDESALPIAVEALARSVLELTRP